MSWASHAVPLSMMSFREIFVGLKGQLFSSILNRRRRLIVVPQLASKFLLGIKEVLTLWGNDKEITIPCEYLFDQRCDVNLIMDSTFCLE